MFILLKLNRGEFLIMKSVNYKKKHHMYLMNHINGDVIEVKMDHKDKSFKKLRLYRQDGLGNYYLDSHAQLDDQNGLATKENIVEAGKKVSRTLPILRIGTIKFIQCLMLITRLSILNLELH